MQRKSYVEMLIILVALALAGCSDDTAGSDVKENVVENNANNATNNQTNGSNNLDPCRDEDGDGYPGGLTCPEDILWDCDDNEAQSNPGLDEICFDSIDNNCNGATDEGCPDCVEGDTQQCGSDVGACEFGQQTCRGGIWSACEGGVTPGVESCNGIDDDCDGELDENPQSLCNDGLKCNGVEICEAGSCQPGEPVDCQALNGACFVGECLEKDGQCHSSRLEDGTPCDDGLFCTDETTCQSGECTGAPRDCSGEGDQCNVGLCDEEADACVSQPKSDGTTCDDGLFCTSTDVCTAGTCGGQARSCASASDQCNTGVCDETADACVPQPRSDGTTCDDGAYCTVGDACLAGACAAGTPRQCGAQGGSCRTGVCDEATDSCTGDPVPDGTSCDDGQFCTITDACVAGTCQGGGVRSCASAGDQCNNGTCNENLNICEPAPKPDNTPCDDGVFCTNPDRCIAGTCGGSMRDCTGVADACNTGVCNEAASACVKQPVSDGTLCPDGSFCTVNDICQAGTCATQPRDCPMETDQCNMGQCDETADSCVAIPRTNGTSCSDGEFCTVSDSCTDGSCGGAGRDCSGSGSECTTGICDEVADTCTSTAKPNGTTCDDGQTCTESDRCNAGSCVGSFISCPGNPCNLGFCSEVQGGCTLTPRADGTNCNDGEFCTLNDACSGGTCVGPDPNPCDGVADQCNTGSCNESTDSCEPTPKSDGTPCTDNQFCTDGDQCLSGTCQSGGPYDCSSVAGNCEVASCNETTDACDVTPDPICCDTSIDADFDGFNQCIDCNDADGSINPNGVERCNGLDDDCDGLIDEDFDADGDGYSTCSTDPDLFDCDDGLASVNPGAPEDCGAEPERLGNGRDDNCNGYIDEGCNPCTTTDDDNDGVSECDGDCDDTNPEMTPGAPELCDGVDNDCNVFTTPNCGVSQECNQDGDGDFSNDPDRCADDQLCACLLSGRNCTGDWRCTSFCNSSDTGPVGDGCQADQTCGLDLLYSANIHGCNVNTDAPGTLRGGALCSQDSDCRSLNCEKPCLGPGCNQKICYDLCTSDDECASNAVCRVSRNAASGPSRAGFDGRCWDTGTRPLSSTPLGFGQSCTSDGACDHLLCTDDPNDGSQYCSQLCCTDSDCPGGYTCSLGGDYEAANVVYPVSGATTCSSNADCVGEGGSCYQGSCAWRIVETAGQCVKDVSGQGTRRGGNACNSNSDCESNFCEKDLGICIEPCCADSTCPMGLGCELQFVQTGDDYATQARVCLSLSTDNVLESL